MEKRWSNRETTNEELSLYEIEHDEVDPILYPDNLRPVDQPITAIVIGAGKRGNIYGSFALHFPDQVKMVGIAEPNPVRNERFATHHNIPPENRF
ncbi:MAG TPA: hypothetical protein PKJ36_15005, partial [Flavihumibacter sp.]|nr:hypothetical protein [Flavihumibacter sp.]